MFVASKRFVFIVVFVVAVCLCLCVSVTLSVSVSVCWFVCCRAEMVLLTSRDDVRLRSRDGVVAEQRLCVCTPEMVLLQSRDGFVAE